MSLLGAHHCARSNLRAQWRSHDLDTDLPRPLYRIYATMKQLGPEIEFQTWRTTPKDFDGAIRMGVMKRGRPLRGRPSISTLIGGPARESAWPAERWPFPAARSCDARSWCSPAGPSGRLW